MSEQLSVSTQTSARLIGQLSNIAHQNGLLDLAGRLQHLWTWVADELEAFDAEMELLPVGESRIEQAAHHLLDMGGKHLRPLCLAVAAKAGTGFDDRARKLALAVELIHSATLLHDDVIDLGDSRRGHSTSRMIYGNAASIYAGDWLLVQALMRIQAANIDGLTDKMLVIINDMVHAESLQLDNRGRINSSFDDYFQVVEGKTAALFRWALYAGARAGGLGEEECKVFETYGLHLGIAFQAVDDLLDIDGDAQVTGKALFTDLREGKMTYPLLVAMQRDSSVAAAVEECPQKPAELPLPPDALQKVLASLHSTGAIEACRDFAAQHSRKAIAAIADVSCSDTSAALTTIAEATTFRKQ
jgi:octaprenyl-diphosphate synthase